LCPLTRSHVVTGHTLRHTHRPRMDELAIDLESCTDGCACGMQVDRAKTLRW
jgi:hypothetical protein